MKVSIDPSEYIRDVVPQKPIGADIFSFCDRSWCNTFYDVPFKAKVCRDNVAVAEFDSYGSWLQSLKGETRARIKRATKRGLVVSEIKYSDDFAYGVWRIYNESSIRQGRRFNHYGISLEDTKNILRTSPNLFLGAYRCKELVGFVELLLGEDTGQIGQFLSLERQRGLLPNNALIAKSVEVCADHKLNWLVYARMGNHPSLDDFKRNNGFKQVDIKRFYIPLTFKGKVILAFGLQLSLQDSIPQVLKPFGFKVYNAVSRIRSSFKIKTFKVTSDIEEVGIYNGL